MCLHVMTADLGPADACLDTRRFLLVLAPRLTTAERAAAARRALTAAGQEQSPGEVVCLCGYRLDVTPPSRRHRHRRARAKVMAVLLTAAGIRKAAVSAASQIPGSIGAAAAGGVTALYLTGSLVGCPPPAVTGPARLAACHCQDPGHGNKAHRIVAVSVAPDQGFRRSAHR